MPSNVPFRLSPIVVLLASIGLFSSSVSYAADDTAIAELKATLERVQQENARVSAENTRLRQELETSKKGTPVETPVAVAPAPVEEEKKANQPTQLKGVVVRGKTTNKLAAQQDVPISVVAISGDELDRLGGNTMRDVIKRVSNISRQDRSNARSSDLTLRGIGRRPNSEALDPSTLVSVDGVSYVYSGLSAWDFVDVNTVEVLRGPTGTAGGKNASVGAVNFTTNRPSFTPSTDISLRVGDHDTVMASAAVGGPVIEDLLAWRGTFYVDKQEGEFGNKYDGGDNTYTDRNKISGKVQFLFTPVENFSALVSVDLQPNTFENDNGLNFFHNTIPTYSNGDATSTANDAATRLGRRWFGQLQSYNYNNNYINDRSGTQNQNDQRALLTGMRGGSAQLDWNIDKYTLTSITAYRKLYFDARNDEGTPFDISAQGGGGLDYRQFSQELKLASEIGGAVDWVTGVYYIRNRNAVDSKTGWGADAGAWFATKPQYDYLDNPTNGLAGRYLLQNSLNGLRKFGQAVNENSSPAIYGQLNWHITDPLTLSTGLRITHEDRTASNFAVIQDNGYAPELNGSLANGIQLSGFDSYYNTTTGAVSVLDGAIVPAGTPGSVVVAANTGALTTNSTSGTRYNTAVAQADAAASKYFGAANYAALTQPQKKALYYAQAIRKAQLGLLYPEQNSERFSKTQYTYFLSPSYKFNDQLTGYLTYQHGEKAGVAQFVNGFSATLKPEITDNIELGFKSSLLDKTLTLNADIFLSEIKDYQQGAQVVDDYTTGINRQNGDLNTIAYTAITGTAPKVEVKGLEFDAFYSGIPYTTLRLSGAYNDAKYKDFPNSQQPLENAYKDAPAFRDVSGKTLPGAAKWTGNMGGDFRLPVAGNKEFHTDINYYVTSRYNNDVTLSDYTWIHGYAIADLGIGLGRQDRTWDVTFLVKNLFDVQAKTYGFSNGVLDTTPRWIGVQFDSKFN
ncbi:MAG: TonB-dependent receptor [Verrucomicrobiaceae bacterium]|nr:TonB-dependent receptor [Verrucomicrobiaceae bacterium]